MNRDFLTKKTMLRYGMTVLDLAVKMIFIIRGR